MSASTSRFYLLQLFGSSVNVKIIEILLQTAITQKSGTPVSWHNFSELSKQASVARSSGKRILDTLLAQGFILEKKVATHAQNPPRMVRLNDDNLAIQELIFFYRKVRGFL